MAKTKGIWLRLTEPPMCGPTVNRLTESLDSFGYGYGLTDSFDEEVDSAVRQFQSDYGLAVDGIVGPATWGVLIFDQDFATSQNPFPGNVITNAHQRPRYYTGPRSWPTIKGVTLHQTGCSMRRWDKLNAHIAVDKGGVLWLVNALTDMIWHAQGLSHSTIGIEVEGNFEGITGKPETLWAPGGGPNHLTAKHKKTFALLGQWLAIEFERHGMMWETCHAHRQSFASRIYDPGQEVWQMAALPWIEKYNLKTEYQGLSAIGTGRPLPKAWTRKAKP
jgi:hypothetical protein